MKDLIQLVILVPLLIMLYQFYSYSVTSTGVEKQKKCLTLGIVCSTIGITSLAFHSTVAVFGGLILIMFGLRLMAHGLDRVDKKRFIDHYEEDDTPK